MKLEWVYKDDLFNPKETPSECGFVYKIEYEDTDGEIYTYYGRKQFWSVKNQEAKKNESKRMGHYRFFGKNKNGKRIKMEETRTSSNWKIYNGSCKYVPEGLKIISKTIISIYKAPIDLTFGETELLFKNNVLFDKYNLNMSIGGKFYAEQVFGTKKYLKGKK